MSRSITARGVGRAGIFVGAALSILLHAWWLSLADSLYDFGSFVAAAQEFGKGLDPYSTANPLVFHVRFESQGLASYAPNLNPPISLPLLSGLATVNPADAILSWRVLTLVVALVSILLILLESGKRASSVRCAWLFSLAGLWTAVQFGQVYALFLLALVAAWWLLRHGKEVAAGAVLGTIAALKPPMAIVILFLLLAGQKRAGLVAAGTGLLLTLYAAFAYGFESYVQWLSASRSFMGLAFPANASLVGLFARFGLPWLGTIASAIVLLLLVLRLRTQRVSAEDSFGLGVLVSLIASPVSWVGYTIFLAPSMVSRPWGVSEKVAAAILAIPFPLVVLVFPLGKPGLFFGWIYGVALLLLLYAWFPRRTGLAALPPVTAPAADFSGTS